MHKITLSLFCLLCFSHLVLNCKFLYFLLFNRTLAAPMVNGSKFSQSFLLLIYLLNRIEEEEVSGEVKSSKSILIKTGYRNLLHSCDFLCFNLMNY